MYYQLHCTPLAHALSGLTPSLISFRDSTFCRGALCYETLSKKLQDNPEREACWLNYTHVVSANMKTSDLRLRAQVDSTELKLHFCSSFRLAASGKSHAEAW